MTDIGFIGLGHMGLPMAVNLIKAGKSVLGFDLSREAQETFRQAGGKIASNIESVAELCNPILTMLQTGEQVHTVCLGEKGLFEIAPPNTLFIDCSSIDVESSKTFHKLGEAAGHQTLDAPVSGGVLGATQGSLTFMVGGEATTLEQALPLLNILGKNIIHTGKAGSGQAAKICNNMILGISMTAISEAFELARKLGLDAKKLHEVVTNSSGQCWAMSQYVPVPGILDNVPANQDYEPGFASDMMLKDLKLSQQAASQSQATTPLGGHATQLYQALVDEGYGDKDFSAIIKLFEPLGSVDG